MVNLIQEGSRASLDKNQIIDNKQKTTSNLPETIVRKISQGSIEKKERKITVDNNNNVTLQHVHFQKEINKPEINDASLDDIEVSNEFYTSFVNFIMSDKQKVANDPQKFFQQFIETPLFASLYSSDLQFIQLIGDRLAKAPSVECAREIINIIFTNLPNKIKSDPTVVVKFTNALSAVLMGIGEKENEEAKSKAVAKGGVISKDTRPDMTRLLDSTPVQAALKRMLTNLVSDDASKKIYEPIVHPLCKANAAVLACDHIVQVFLEKTLDTNDKKPSEIRTGIKYKITLEAYQKIKSEALVYHYAIGTRPIEAFKKIWTDALKSIFTNFFEFVERFTPYFAGADNCSEKFTFTSIQGERVEIEAWKIGALVEFGAMVVLQTILTLWVDNVQFKVEEIFDDPELLRKSLIKLLFDQNFFFSSLMQHEELNKLITSDDYRTQVSEHWKSKLREKLKEVSANKPKQSEVDLVNDIDQLLIKYKDKLLPSQEFEIEFNDRITQFNMNKFSRMVRKLITEESYVDLIKELPKFEFSEEKKAKEITVLFEAIMNNNLENLPSIKNEQFAKKVEKFLKVWGGKLQSVLQKKLALTITTKLIEKGRFIHTISDKLQEKFKLPFNVDDLPTMMDGMRSLPDKDLALLIQGFLKDPDLKKLVKDDFINKLHKKPLSDKVHAIETFMVDEVFFKKHFNILSEMNTNSEIKKFLESTQGHREKFIESIVHLANEEDFQGGLKKLWSEKNKGGGREQLLMIASNPNVYKRYDLLTAWVLFKEYHNKFNETDKELLREKTRFFIEVLYDVPTLAAAVKIKDESIEILDNPYDDYTKIIKKEWERFGAEGKIQDQNGNPILYRKALGYMDGSFLDLDRLIEKKGRPLKLCKLSEKEQKICLEYFEKEIENLAVFLKEFSKNKADPIKRNGWHYLLRLAISAGNEKYIRLGLKEIELISPLTVEDINKHRNYILAKNKLNGCEIMSSYLSQKQDHLPLKHSVIGLKKELEFKKQFKTALRPTKSELLIAMKSLPDSNVKNFLNWIIDTKNRFAKEYFQLTSITKTIKLEIALFNELLLDKDILLDVLMKFGPLNAYFYTEVFSDHLGMNLANQQEDSVEYKSKLAALSNLNKVISGQTKELSPEDFGHFSIYQQCLSPEKMQEIVSGYQKKFESAGLQKELEFSYFTMMQLNISSCRVLLQSAEKNMKRSKLYSLFEQGIMDRYAAVDKLIYNYKNLSLDESLELGKKTILIAPTLTYCISAIDQVMKIPNLSKIIKDGSLKEALDIAAKLVRLLNDIGTIPLTKPKESLEKFKTSFDAMKGKDTFFNIIKNSKDVSWSRVAKDLKFGEHNLCLDSLYKLDELKRYQQFEANILYLSEIYQKLEASLYKIVSKMDKMVASLILGVVLTHKETYSKAMDEEGEYAIASNKKEDKIASSV